MHAHFGDLICTSLEHFAQGEEQLKGRAVNERVGNINGRTLLRYNEAVLCGLVLLCFIYFKAAS